MAASPLSDQQRDENTDVARILIFIYYLLVIHYYWAQYSHTVWESDYEADYLTVLLYICFRFSVQNTTALELTAWSLPSDTHSRWNTHTHTPAHLPTHTQTHKHLHMCPHSPPSLLSLIWDTDGWGRFFKCSAVTTCFFSPPPLIIFHISESHCWLARTLHEHTEPLMSQNGKSKVQSPCSVNGSADT